MFSLLASVRLVCIPVLSCSRLQGLIRVLVYSQSSPEDYDKRVGGGYERTCFGDEAQSYHWYFALLLLTIIVADPYFFANRYFVRRIHWQGLRSDEVDSFSEGLFIKRDLFVFLYSTQQLIYSLTPPLPLFPSNSVEWAIDASLSFPPSSFRPSHTSLACSITQDKFNRFLSFSLFLLRRRRVKINDQTFMVK